MGVSETWDPRDLAADVTRSAEADAACHATGGPLLTGEPLPTGRPARLLPPGDATGTECVDDGFGNACRRCGPDCDLQVVRPGRFQCNCADDDCPDASWRTGLGEVHAQPCPDGEAHVEHERDDNLWCPGVREAPAVDPEADAPPPAYLAECARHGLALTQMPAIPTCCERSRIVGRVLVGDTGQPTESNPKEISYSSPGRSAGKIGTTEWQRQNAAEVRAEQADEIRAVIGDAIAPSIRKVYLPDVMDRVMAVVGPLIAERDEERQRAGTDGGS